jgi:hypothetical protein
MVKQVARYFYHGTFCIMILVSLHTKSSSMFHAVCSQIVPAKMKNPDNEDIIIPVCILLIVVEFQQYRGNRFGRLWVRPWIARRNHPFRVVWVGFIPYFCLLFIQMEETSLFLWPNNITTISPFPAMFYLPCADHVLLFVDGVVTS